MKNIVLKIMVTAVFLFSSLLSVAQPSNTPKNPGPADERFLPSNNPNETPIDDAVLFLLIAAVGLGIYMVARNYKKRAVRS